MKEEFIITVNFQSQDILDVMQQQWFELLTKQNRTPQQCEQVIQFMSSKFFKSLITPLPVDKLIENIQLKQWSAQTILFSESEKIQSYYFLLQGSVNLYKKIRKNEQNQSLQIVKCINQPSLLSDSYFAHSSHRNFTAIANDCNITCKGFILTKSVLEEHCNYLVKQYKILKTYFCNFLNLSSDRFHKINLYENVQFKTFSYGQRIDINSQIYIVYSGECQMNFQEKSTKKQRKSVPYKTKTNNPNLYRPLLKLCQNECFGMQLIYAQNEKHPKNTKFKYVVTSQNLVCISVSICNLGLFPKQMSEKLKIKHFYHIGKLQQNLYFQCLKGSDSQRQEFFMYKSLSPGLIDVYSPKKGGFIRQKQIKTICAEISKPKFSSNQENKAQSFLNKKQASKYKLPKPKLKGLGLHEQPGFSRLNKTQNISHSVSSLCNSLITPRDIVQLRKMFCLGFDLQNGCDKQLYHMNKQKQVIKQPKGFFPFAKNKQSNKENQSNAAEGTQKKVSHSKHKQWSSYLKLPKIDKSGFP